MDKDTGTGGDFFWQVRVTTGESYEGATGSTFKSYEDFLVENVQFVDSGVKWQASRDIASSSRAVPGETVLVPWWRVVSVKRLHISKIPAEFRSPLSPTRHVKDIEEGGEA